MTFFPLEHVSFRGGMTHSVWSCPLPYQKVLALDKEIESEASFQRTVGRWFTWCFSGGFSTRKPNGFCSKLDGTGGFLYFSPLKK